MSTIEETTNNIEAAKQEILAMQHVDDATKQEMIALLEQNQTKEQREIKEAQRYSQLDAAITINPALIEAKHLVQQSSPEKRGHLMKLFTFTTDNIQVKDTETGKMYPFEINNLTPANTEQYTATTADICHGKGGDYPTDEYYYSKIGFEKELEGQTNRRAVNLEEYEHMLRLMPDATDLHIMIGARKSGGRRSDGKFDLGGSSSCLRSSDGHVLRSNSVVSCVSSSPSGSLFPVRCLQVG